MLLTIEIEIAWYKQFPSPTTLCAIYELRTVLGNLAATPQIFGRIYLHVVLIVDNICSLIWNIQCTPGTSALLLTRVSFNFFLVSYLESKRNLL